MEVTFVPDTVNETIVPRAIVKPANEQERLLFDLWAAQLFSIDPTDIDAFEIVGDQSGVFEGYSIGVKPASAPVDPFPVPEPVAPPEPTIEERFALPEGVNE